MKCLKCGGSRWTQRGGSRYRDLRFEGGHLASLGPWIPAQGAGELPDPSFKCRDCGILVEPSGDSAMQYFQILHAAPIMSEGHSRLIERRRPTRDDTGEWNATPPAPRSARFLDEPRFQVETNGGSDPQLEIRGRGIVESETGRSVFLPKTMKAHLWHESRTGDNLAPPAAWELDATFDYLLVSEKAVIGCIARACETQLDFLLGGGTKHDLSVESLARASRLHPAVVARIAYWARISVDGSPAIHLYELIHRRFADGKGHAIGADAAAELVERALQSSGGEAATDLHVCRHLEAEFGMEIEPSVVRKIRIDLEHRKRAERAILLDFPKEAFARFLGIPELSGYLRSRGLRAFDQLRELGEMAWERAYSQATPHLRDELVRLRLLLQKHREARDAA